MQERLTGDPYVALGVAPTATASEIRTAFLELTKTYHPARFGYMSSDLQRLSNEVFLSLRAAYDWIVRPARASASAKADRSGTYARSDRSGNSGVFPAIGASAAARADRSGTYPQVISHAPSGPLSAAPSAPVAPATHAGSAAPGAAPSALSAPAGSGRAASSRLPSPSLGLPADPRATPPAGVRIGAMRAPAPAGVPASSGRPGISRPSAAGGLARPEDRELAGVIDQLHRGQWDAARTALTALAARAPEQPKYRALISYARGREAQLAQRLDEARVELQDALQIDPELQLAKTALAELFTRRK